MKGRLTKRQEEILSFITSSSRDNSICPSLDEIADHFSIAVSSVYDHITALEKKGVIERIPGQARSIRLKGEENQLKAVTIPFTRKDGRKETITLSTLFLKPEGSYFAIEMSDDSMKNIGIMEGDTLIFRSSARAEERDIIYFLDENTEEVMVRRYTREASRFVLLPESDNVPSKICRHITVYGVLAKVFRVYE
ncbi:MAG: LexA family protein [Bullifex sp.]